METLNELIEVGESLVQLEGNCKEDDEKEESVSKNKLKVVSSIDIRPIFPMCKRLFSDGTKFLELLPSSPKTVLLLVSSSYKSHHQFIQLGRH